VKRIELPGLPGELHLSELNSRVEVARLIYRDRRLAAWLYRMPPGEGIVVAVRWEEFGWEFVTIEDWETPDLESFVFALADFEWSVVLMDHRRELLTELLEFMDEVGLESHEEQAYHFLKAGKEAS